MTFQLPALLLCGATLSLALPAQSLTFAEGTPGSLAIVTVAETDPNGAATTLLQNVELLPVEITGRTLAQQHDGTRSRRVERHGIARVELPGGGRVLRYRRAGGQAWGFLHVAADGAARVVLERPGTGTALLDPFADRIGVDADGVHAAVPLRAGGLCLVRLDGGTFASTGRTDRVVASTIVEEKSVLVGAGMAWFQTPGDRLWRCAVADGATPVDVSPPPVPAGELEDQMVIARDGSVVVFLYGPDHQQRLWRIGATGPATVLPPGPDKYEEPGYLPEEPGEPAMLLADDGSRLFYVDSEPDDELWLLDMNGALPPLQITADTRFQPYIGSHILPRFLGPRLAVAIGDPAQMDWFAADLANGGTVVNLTNTGGVPAPFASGTIAPVDAVTAPAGALLVADQQPTGVVLRRVDLLAGGLATLEQGLLAAPAPGSALAGAPDVVVRTTGGDRLYAGATGALLAPLPPGLTMTPPVHGLGFAATWLDVVQGWGAVFLYTPGAVVSGPIEHGVTQLCATAGGGLVVVGGGFPLRYHAPGVSVVIQRPAVAMRLCLSGAGG